MARKEVQGDELGNLFSFREHGQCLEGKYIGSREVDGQYGRQTLYDVEFEGVVYSAPGSAGLNGKMAKVDPGSRVWITYIDDKVMGKNRDGTDKNPMKVFKVEVDDGQLALAPTGTNGPAPSGGPAGATGSNRAPF